MNDQKMQKLFLNVPYEELDTEAGLPNFRNQEEKIAYYKILNYFDKTEVSERLLQTNAFIYEHPCPLSRAKNLYRLTFGAVESLSSLPQIQQEIEASTKRIEYFKEEITNWFAVLIKSLRQRKVHNPLGTFDAPVFNSYHLLDAFSIYSRPNDFPNLEKDLEDIEEKNKLPFLVEPGETFLHNSKMNWFPWETDVDKRRENLKYADVVGGVPSELRVDVEQSFPEIKEEDVIPTVTVNKKIQTEKLRSKFTLKSDDEEMEDTEGEKQTETTSDNESYDLTKKDDTVDQEFDKKTETSSSHALKTTFSEPNVEQSQVKKLKMPKVHKRRYK